MAAYGSRLSVPAETPTKGALRPILWFLAGLGTYGLSAAHGPMWADSSKLTIYALTPYVPSLNPGDHPGWSLIANLWFHLLAWVSPIRAAHLLSACAGAAAVALIWMVVFKQTRSAARAHTTAAMLLAAHAMWWSSSLAETYAPALALALASLLFEGERTLHSTTSGVFAGCAAAVHPLSLVVTFPALVRQRRSVSLWTAFVVGLSPVWLGLFQTMPDPLTGHVSGHAASWGWHVHAFLDPGRAVQGCGIVVALLLLNVGPLGLWGLASGIRHLARPASRPGLAVAVVYVAVLCLYAPFRLHLMVLFFVAALLIAVAPHLPRRGWIAHIFIQAAIYVLVPLVLTAAGHDSLGVRRLPDRNNAWYFLCPVKAAEHGPARYAAALLSAAPHGAVILADFNPGAVLALVQRVEHVRPDLHIVPTAVDDANGSSDPAQALAARIASLSTAGHAVVLAGRWAPYYHPRELERRFGVSLVPCGPGWQVTGPQRAATPRQPPSRG